MVPISSDKSNVKSFLDLPDDTPCGVNIEIFVKTYWNKSVLVGMKIEFSV